MSPAAHQGARPVRGSALAQSVGHPSQSLCTGSLVSLPVELPWGDQARSARSLSLCSQGMQGACSLPEAGTTPFGPFSVLIQPALGARTAREASSLEKRQEKKWLCWVATMSHQGLHCQWL